MTFFVLPILFLPIRKKEGKNVWENADSFHQVNKLDLFEFILNFTFQININLQIDRLPRYSKLGIIK